MAADSRKRNDFFKRGRLAFEAGQFEKAIHAFNKVIEWDPLDANAHTFRGLAHRQIRNFDAALKDLQQVVDIDPSHRVGYLNLGCVQRDVGKIEEALLSFEHAESGDSENPLVFQNRATALIVKGDWEAARSDCETALALAPEGAAAYAILAHVYLGIGDQGLAMQTVERSLELDPEEAEAYRVRGIIRCSEDDLENGISDFIHARELNPNVQLDYLDKPEVLLDKLLEKLHQLIGLDTVKEEVRSLINLVKIRQLRKEARLPSVPMSLHLVFTGNPGTGKTTIARLISLIYHVLGVLSKGHLVEVDRAGLVAGYVGQTALKVHDVLNKSMGGVLFIDEAYSLTSRGDEKDFGLEAIDTLIKGMEDKRSDLVLIVAGYPEKMRQFLKANPGIKSRFSKVIRFNDYSATELMGIFKKMCRDHRYELASEAKLEALKAFEALNPEEVGLYGNGRGVRNYFELTITRQANRLGELDKIAQEQLVEILVEDLPDDDFWVHD
jgi:tetratricopeptide (TPR) repeat protein